MRAQVVVIGGGAFGASCFYHLTARGVRFIQPPTEHEHAGKIATLVDPDGLEIDLGEPHH